MWSAREGQDSRGREMEIPLSCEGAALFSFCLIGRGPMSETATARETGSGSVCHATSHIPKREHQSKNRRWQRGAAPPGDEAVLLEPITRDGDDDLYYYYSPFDSPRLRLRFSSFVVSWTRDDR